MPRYARGDDWFTVTSPPSSPSTIRAEYVTLMDIGAPRLSHLKLERCVTSQVLRALARTTWSNLAELDLDLSNEMSSPGDVAPLLADPERFPKLRRLRLRRAAYTDEMGDALLASPILGQIDVLDLSGGTMSDGMAESFAEHPHRFARLKRLDVSGNAMTRDGYHALRTLPGRVIFGEQVDAEERYEGIQE